MIWFSINRYFIIYHLPNLRFLDSSPISSLESDEALRRFYWMDKSTRQQQQAPRTCDGQDLRVNNTKSDHNNGRPASETTTELRQIDSQEAGFQLTIITNHSDESTESYSASALAGHQPSKGQSSLRCPAKSRYTLRLGFRVVKDWILYHHRKVRAVILTESFMPSQPTEQELLRV